NNCHLSSVICHLVPADRLELTSLDLAHDLLRDLLLRHRLAPELALAEATELQDLEHVYEIQARGDGRQPEADHHGRPAGVEVPVVVRVRDESKGEREP